jgi:hypothetical protein
MKPLLLFLIICIQVSVKSHGQNISLKLRNVSLEKVFQAIEKQSNYHFIYTKEEIVNEKPVSIDIKSADLILS